MTRRSGMSGALLGAALLFAGPPATARVALPEGARYVAMGSSFASGPGVTTSADTPANRCTRSADNFAHQLARARKLSLTDVSCGGATSEHVLSGWNELPPQVDALTADTRLVTITIGGNDLKYVGGLMAASCRTGDAMPGGRTMRCGSLPPVTPQEAAGVERSLDAIAAEVKRRAPNATLVFVEYLALLPDRGGCAITPISTADADRARDAARQLSAITRRVAKRAGAKVLRADASRGHDACAAVPWVTGFDPAARGTGKVPYHPNLDGMTAIARSLDRML